MSIWENWGQVLKYHFFFLAGEKRGQANNGKVIGESLEHP